MSSHIS